MLNPRFTARPGSQIRTAESGIPRPAKWWARMLIIPRQKTPGASQ